MRIPSSTLGKRDVMDEWPVNQTTYLTLDLEYDYAGVSSKQSLTGARQIRKLVTVLEEFDVPLSCFLQTELLETASDVVNTLDEAGVPVEFHSHTHTHPLRKNANVEYELTKSLQRIRSNFGTDPLGFRFPEGDTEPGDMAMLADHDVAFDSSLFPTWRPGRFNNLREPTTPFRDLDTGIVELPFSTYSKRIRVPVAMSYLKLLGIPFQKMVSRNPPAAIVFDMHMHDLVPTSATNDLPKHYQLIFSERGETGLNILSTLIHSLREQGYNFELISSLYEDVDNALS